MSKIVNDWCISSNTCRWFSKNKDGDDICSHPKNKDDLKYLKRCEKPFCPIKKDVHTA